MDPRLARQQQQQQAAYSQQQNAQRHIQINTSTNKPQTSQEQQQLQPSKAGQQTAGPQTSPKQETQPKQKLPDGPLKRNKWLQEKEQDCSFQPRYQLCYGLPEIPVRPKLFKYRLDTQNRTSKYEFTTVELNQEHNILVDYNMGVRVDLIDRTVYGSSVTAEQQQKMESDSSIFCERDKFLLSDRDTIPTLKPKQPKQEHKPANFIDSQLKQTTQTFQAPEQDLENLIYSGANIINQDQAVQQIKKTFTAVKRLKIGDAKPGDPIVTVKSISEIVPSQFAYLVPSYAIVVNDDDIGEKAKLASELTNGIVMHQYTDIEGENRKALYYCSNSKNLPSSISDKILGKRARQFDVIQQQHIRDYTFSEVHGGAKGEKYDYMLIKTNENKLEYVPVISKVKLNKKRLAQIETMGSDGEAVTTTDKQISQIFFAPRGLTGDDSKQMINQISDLGKKCGNILESSAIFKSKKEIADAEQEAGAIFKQLFKSDQEQDEDQEHEDRGDIQDDLMEASDLFAPSGDEEKVSPQQKQKRTVKESESAVSEDDIF